MCKCIEYIFGGHLELNRVNTQSTKKSLKASHGIGVWSRAKQKHMCRYFFSTFEWAILQGSFLAVDGQQLNSILLTIFLAMHCNHSSNSLGYDLYGFVPAVGLDHVYIYAFCMHRELISNYSYALWFAKQQLDPISVELDGNRHRTIYCIYNRKHRQKKKRRMRGKEKKKTKRNVIINIRNLLMIMNSCYSGKFFFLLLFYWNHIRTVKLIELYSPIFINILREQKLHSIDVRC